MQFGLWRAAAFVSSPIHLLRCRSRQRERLNATAMTVCLFVSPSVAKMQFSQKLSNLELWCLLTTYRKLCKLNWAFQRTHYLLDSYNPRWLRSAILKIDITLFLSAESGSIWIKFRRLVQNDMSTAVIRSKSKPKVEFQYSGCLGEFNGMWRMSSQSQVSYCRV